MIINSSTGLTQTLAKTALKSMADKDAVDGRKIGDQFLASIEEKGTDEAERKLAHWARAASANRLSSSSGYNTEYVTLQTLSSDIDVPLTKVMADVAIKSLNGASDTEDMRAIGNTFLQGIKSEGTEQNERIVANAALNASGKRLTNADASFAQFFAFQALKSGVSEGIGKVIADIASKSICEAGDTEDKRTIGSAFIKEIKANSQDENERILASTADSATSIRLANSSGADAQLSAFKMIKDGLDNEPEVMLAKYGGKVVRDDAYDAEDGRAMGHVVLDNIIQYSKDEGKKILAQTAHDASSGYLYNSDAVDIQLNAFKDIKEI